MTYPQFTGITQQNASEGDSVYHDVSVRVEKRWSHGVSVDAKNTSPTEVRGTSIRNGIERKVSAGDVINMPAGLPHQFLLEPGKQIKYIDVVVSTTDK
jgi:hypothetical protein